MAAPNIVNVTTITGITTFKAGIATTENVRTSSLVVSGVSTLGTVVVGGATTQLIVVGDARITGIVTATSFSGSGANLTGISSVSFATTSFSLSGSPNITVGNIVGTALTLSGNLTVNGTQTIINTTSLEVADKNIGIGSISSPTDTLADGAGLTIYGTTNKTLTWSNSTPPYFNLVGGYLQVSGLDLSSLLREGVNIVAGKLSDNFNINLEYGMVFLFTTTETTTSTPNIRYSSSISLNSVMNIGEAISVTLITTAAAAAYSAQLTIDGNAVTEYWIGGSAPSSGGSYGYDLHTYTIIKTASATFAVIANRSKTSA